MDHESSSLPASRPNGAGTPSLADLVHVLLRRWKILAGAAIVSVAVGVGTAAMRPPLYSYSTTVQIGGPIGGDGVRPIIEPSKLAGMLGVGHLIRSMDFSSRFPIASSIDVSAAALGSSPLLRLSVQGKLEDEERILEFLREINNLIIQECAQLIDLGQRQDLAAKKLLLAQQIDHVRSRIGRDERELTRINELNRSYQSQLAEAKATINSIMSERNSTIRGAEANVRALALLVTGNELQHAQDSYYRIDEQLNDKLPRQREGLNAVIAQSQLELAGLEADLQKVVNQMENLRETRVQIPPARSANAVESGAGWVAAMSLVVGGLLGLLGAFLAELAANYKPLRRPV